MRLRFQGNRGGSPDQSSKISKSHGYRRVRACHGDPHLNFKSTGRCHIGMFEVGAHEDTRRPACLDYSVY